MYSTFNLSGGCCWRFVCDMPRKDACSHPFALQTHLLWRLCIWMVSHIPPSPPSAMWPFPCTIFHTSFSDFITYLCFLGLVWTMAGLRGSERAHCAGHWWSQQTSGRSVTVQQASSSSYSNIREQKERRVGALLHSMQMLGVCVRACVAARSACEQCGPDAVLGECTPSWSWRRTWLCIVTVYIFIPCIGSRRMLEHLRIYPDHIYAQVTT